MPAERAAGRQPHEPNQKAAPSLGVPEWGRDILPGGPAVEAPPPALAATPAPPAPGDDAAPRFVHTPPVITRPSAMPVPRPAVPTEARVPAPASRPAPPPDPRSARNASAPGTASDDDGLSISVLPRWLQRQLGRNGATMTPGRTVRLPILPAGPAPGPIAHPATMEPDDAAPVVAPTADGPFLIKPSTAHRGDALKRLFVIDMLGSFGGFSAATGLAMVSAWAYRVADSVALYLAGVILLASGAAQLGAAAWLKHRLWRETESRRDQDPLTYMDVYLRPGIPTRAFQLTFGIWALAAIAWLAAAVWVAPSGPVSVLGTAYNPDFAAAVATTLTLALYATAHYVAWARVKAKKRTVEFVNEVSHR